MEPKLEEKKDTKDIKDTKDTHKVGLDDNKVEVLFLNKDNPKEFRTEYLNNDNFNFVQELYNLITIGKPNRDDTDETLDKDNILPLDTKRVTYRKTIHMNYAVFNSLKKTIKGQKINEVATTLLYPEKICGNACLIKTKVHKDLEAPKKSEEEIEKEKLEKKIIENETKEERTKRLTEEFNKTNERKK